MANDYVDDCMFAPASGGTGNFVFSAAVTGYRSPVGLLVDGAIYEYRAQSADLLQWENGSGAWTAATNTVARTTITASSNAGAAVNFTLAPQVGLTILSASIKALIRADQAQSFTAAQQAQARANIGAIALYSPQCRVTLASGVPVTASDVVGATSVYLTPSGGNQIPVYDGAEIALQTFTEQTLALDNNAAHTNYHASGKNYDYFYAYVAGTCYFGTGPKWDDGAVAGSNILRGTGAASTDIEVFVGLPVNKNSMVLRFGNAAGNTVTVPARQATYIGSGRMTADGITEDSLAKRFLWNAYNQVLREMKVSDTAVSWNYLASTFRQFNANAANQIAYIVGLIGMPVKARACALVQIASGTSFAVVGIGVDSTSVPANYVGGLNAIGTSGVQTYAEYAGYPGLGYHILVPLEYGPGGATTVTWNGTDTASPPRWNTGIFGEVWG